MSCIVYGCRFLRKHQIYTVFFKHFLRAGGDADAVNVTQHDTSTDTLPQGEVVAVVLPPSLFVQITQDENDTNGNTSTNTEATGVIFTFYESSVLFPLANGTNSSDTLIMIGTPVIGAEIPGLEVIELAEPFTILIRLNNEVS